MTTRAQLLGRVHRLLNDTPEVQTIDELTGNASTTVFDLSNRPIEPASEVITIDGATQTRDIHFTIDNENGNVTFVTAPSNGVAIAGSFKNSYYSQQAKIDYINEAITNHLFQEIFTDITHATSARVLADCESDETWTNGTADTIFYRSGTQGIRLPSGTQVYTTVTADLTGTDSDKVKFYLYVPDASDVSSAVIKLHTTADTNYYSYTFTSDVSNDGWNTVEIDKSEFSETGSPSWASIVRIELTVTGSISTLDQIVFERTDEYSHLYNLPSNCEQLLDVYVYDIKGNARDRLRRYELIKQSGTSSVDQIYITDNIPRGRKIGIRYIKQFTSLATDAATTDLPTQGEECAILYAAYALVRDREPLLARFDELPTNFEETSKASGVAMRPAQYYYDLFTKSRTQAGLSPNVHVSSRQIQ